MLDRVREALFGTLGERLVGARVLDLYSGAGSLGLEAVSRGAVLVRMVERDTPTFAVLKQNVAKLQAEETVQAVRGEALSERAWAVSEGAPGWDVVFLDPPYAELEGAAGRAEVLAALRALVTHRLAPGGVVVLHAPRRTLRERDFPGLACEERDYGSTALWYVEPARAPEPEAPQ
jgi:16S rRNA (guanine966-N2)-methyltransferase